MNFIDFVYLIQIMFIEYLYSGGRIDEYYQQKCGNSCPDIGGDTYTARGHSDRVKQLFGNYRSFGNILFRFIMFVWEIF